MRKQRLTAKGQVTGPNSYNYPLGDTKLQPERFQSLQKLFQSFSPPCGAQKVKITITTTCHHTCKHTNGGTWPQGCLYSLQSHTHTHSTLLMSTHTVHAQINIFPLTFELWTLQLVNKHMEKNPASLYTKKCELRQQGNTIILAHRISKN